VITPLRSDCPDGLVLEIGGDSFPVNAAGRLGELGENGARSVDGGADRIAAGQPRRPFDCCSSSVRTSSARGTARHHPEQVQACGAYGALPRRTSASIVVPAGTLSSSRPTD